MERTWIGGGGEREIRNNISINKTPIPLIKTGQEDIIKSMVMDIINEENSGLSLKISMLLHIYEQENYYAISINKELE